MDVLGCGLGSAETGACSAAPAGEAGRSANVSARALIIRLPTRASFAQDGTNPPAQALGMTTVPVHHGQRRLGWGGVVPGRVGETAGVEAKPFLPAPAGPLQAESAAHVLPPERGGGLVASLLPAAPGDTGPTVSPSAPPASGAVSVKHSDYQWRHYKRRWPGCRHLPGTVSWGRPG